MGRPGQQEILHGAQEQERALAGRPRGRQGQHLRVGGDPPGEALVERRGEAKLRGREMRELCTHASEGGRVTALRLPMHPFCSPPHHTRVAKTVCGGHGPAVGGTGGRPHDRSALCRYRATALAREHPSMRWTNATAVLLSPLARQRQRLMAA
jgi:hypothetical protein